MRKNLHPHFSICRSERPPAGPLALSPFIEHTLLKPEATKAEVKRLAEEAKAHSFVGACVNAWHLEYLVEALEGAPVKAIGVIGFPLGATLTRLKVAEARAVVQAGAQELDMVINLGALKAGENTYIEEEIAAVVEAAEGAWVKVIIETALLTDEEKALACRLAQSGGAHFVKTCTGFGGGRATVEDVELMRQVVGADMGVKASGGIKTVEEAVALLRAGADRLGTSSGVKLVQERLVQESTSHEALPFRPTSCM